MIQYRVVAIHFADRLKLKDVREKLSLPPIEFSNYEIVLKFEENSYAFIYNYGSIVFFNVSDEIQERELARLQSFKPTTDIPRTSDLFYVEVNDGGLQAGETANRVFFDRVVVQSISFSKIKIVCMLIAESTALEYYEILIENLLEKVNVYSRKLETEGRNISASEDFLKFIGLVLSTKSEIISNLYIVDSPDETWESPELDRIFQDLKTMVEVDIRYRALDYKIRMIQESLDIFVDLSKSRREAMLELVVIVLIAFEIVLSLFHRGQN